MDSIERQDIYRKAVEKWGIEAQLFMLVEECAELQKAASKIYRGNKNNLDLKRQLGEEMADVLNMIDQLQSIFNIDGLVRVVRQEKMERLKEILRKED